MAEEFRNELQQFAIAVNREVGVRMGSFKPDGFKEVRQQKEGCVPIFKLDALNAR